MSNETLTHIKNSFISQAVTVLIASVATLVSSYFLLLSHGTRISALEENSVRKDVLSETLEPMKETTIRIETKLDRLIERESMK